MSAPTRLAQLAAAIQAGEPVPPELATWLVNAVEKIDLGVPPARALDFARGPGQRSWRKLVAIASRDTDAWEVVQKFKPGDRRAEQARWLSTEFASYASGAWLRERDAVDCPQRHIGRLAEYFWRMLKAIEKVPSRKHCEAILAKKSFKLTAI